MFAFAHVYVDVFLMLLVLLEIVVLGLSHVYTVEYYRR